MSPSGKLLVTELRRLVVASSDGRAVKTVCKFIPSGSNPVILVMFSSINVLMAGMFSVKFCCCRTVSKLSLRVGMFSVRFCSCTMVKKLSLRMLLKFAGMFSVT